VLLVVLAAFCNDAPDLGGVRRELSAFSPISAVSLVRSPCCSTPSESITSARSSRSSRPSPGANDSSARSSEAPHSWAARPGPTDQLGWVPYGPTPLAPPHPPLFLAWYFRYSVIHAPSGRCASVATVRRPHLYDLHLSQISCVNARFRPIPQSARSVALEKPVRLTESELAGRLAPSARPGRRKYAAAAVAWLWMTGQNQAQSSHFTLAFTASAPVPPSPAFLPAASARVTLSKITETTMPQLKLIARMD